LCGDNMCFGSTCHREVMNIGASCQKVELYTVQGRIKVISPKCTVTTYTVLARVQRHIQKAVNRWLDSS
jgi:hypothetical protein